MGETCDSFIVFVLKPKREESRFDTLRAQGGGEIKILHCVNHKRVLRGAETEKKTKKEKKKQRLRKKKERF